MEEKQTNNTVEHNILDGPYLRTSNESMDVIHHRYWLLLVVGAVILGLISFYSPVPMASALHCHNDETDFVYAEVSGPFEDAAKLDRSDFSPLTGEALTILTGRTTSHMMQTDATYPAQEAIVVLPAEDTNYGLYAAAEGSFVFAIDANKFRYSVKENETFYPALQDAVA